MFALTAPQGGELSAGPLRVDLDAYVASWRGEILDLTGTQIELIALLIEHRRRVVSREDLARALKLRQPRSVDVLLTSLRQKLGRPIFRNVRGRGWIIDEQVLA